MEYDPSKVARLDDIATTNATEVKYEDLLDALWR